MKIDCRGCWREAVAYFRREDVQAKMERLGLRVVSLDAARQVVTVAVEEDSSLDSLAAFCHKESVKCES